jgi:hypothetical protein
MWSGKGQVARMERVGSRRDALAAALVVPLAPRYRVARAELVTARVGSLKLIHSITPWFYDRFLPETIALESPSDCTMRFCQSGGPPG